MSKHLLRFRVLEDETTAYAREKSVADVSQARLLSGVHLNINQSTLSPRAPLLGGSGKSLKSLTIECSLLVFRQNDTSSIY